VNYLSVFSGIEAASVAWQSLGFNALGFSEIDPFCSVVLRHRYPGVRNYGDINNFKEWGIGQAVDVVVGGSPCQSYSIAGNRKGADDERGRLMFTYGNMVNHFRPRWVVWENVPGVLSSNRGRDFAQFIYMLGGFGYGLAWRILDAQYFGVPQRRRRVFVIGYFGDVRRSAAVLFDGAGGGGHSEALETEGGGASGRVEDGAGAAIWNIDGGTDGIAGASDKTNALTARAAMGGDTMPLVYNIHPHDSRITKSKGVIDTMTGRWGTGGNNVPLCLMDQGGDVMQVEAGITGTLWANEHQHNPIVFNRALNTRYKSSETAATILGDYHEASAINLTIDEGGLRRITPKEAERLQGFPDDWTKVPYRNKSAEQCPDGQRYKAVGNSMAVPVMRWLGGRILKIEKLFEETESADHNK
jgi:DNA (cytosine-5)-methyltransferase 1